MAMLETPHNEDPSITKLKKRTRKTSPFRSPRASEFSESPCVVLRFRTPYKTTTQDNSFFEIVYSTPSMNEPSIEKPPIRLSRELNSLQIPTQERNSSPLYYYNERPKRTKKPTSQSVNNFNTSTQHHDSNSSQEDEEDFLDDSFHEKTGSGHDSEIERSLKKTKPKVKGFGKNSPFLKKKCVSCGTKKTPYWRDGWNGVPLCNACGIRYQKYRVRCLNCVYIPRKEETSRFDCPRCGQKMS